MAARRVKKAPYFRMYCGWWTDSRVLSISVDAELVWLRSIAFSKVERLDGFLPGYALLALYTRIDTPPAVVAAELVDAGFWIVAADRDGWQIKGWADYQTTADEDDDRRENNRVRQDRFRHPERYAANGHGEETQ